MPDRKTLLVEQSPPVLTGIDFIRVLDKDVQDRIHVFFIVPPDQLVPPMVAPAAIPNLGDSAPATLAVSLSAAPGIRLPEIASMRWRRVSGMSGPRVVLDLRFDAPGDFTDYHLAIDHAQIDPYFARETFSFQQACPDPFDCAPEPCPPDDLADPPLDYLARDFGSFSRALSDYAARTYPDWREDTPADMGVMLKELLAYAGDELAWLQDRIGQETRFETATQRRSLAALAALVAYRPDPGRAARSEIAIEVAAGLGGGVSPAGDTAWAVISGEEPVPFSQAADLWVHERWNAIPLHVLDSNVPCIAKGATQAYLRGDAPTAGEIDPGSPLSAEDFWIGRRMALTWRPAGDARAEQSAVVTITRVTKLADALQPTEGAPTALARVDWDTPLPFAAPLAEMTACVNVAEVVAGRKVTETFRVGSNTRLAEALAGLAPSSLAPLLGLPRAVEREGPSEGDAGREAILRYGLRASETRGLGWDAVDAPRLTLEVLDPATLQPDPTEPAWVFFPDLVAADDDDRAFTLEPGLWRDVVHHQRPYDTLIFDDYASADGWSIRFGAGAFGQAPPVGTVFRVTYDTGPGVRANLPAGAINRIADPTGQSGASMSVAAAVRNPLPITGGRDEETPAHIRLHAPVAWRRNPRRAVRPEDYEAILGKLPFVQRANAVTRHTGAWSTDFVAIDPLSGTALDPQQAETAEGEISCIRQATRDARRMEAEYLDLDLEIPVCVAAGHASADVIEAVTRALAPPGYFDPDNFTFGQPLHRSGIEARVQAVPGVRFVGQMRYRLRGQRDWRVFDTPTIEVARNRILRLMNDPLFPGRGTLRVHRLEAVT